MQHRQLVLDLRARQHRSRLTPSEAALWARINRGQLGVWFRRQVVIGRFIVDFLAPKARLAVEVDGGSHAQRRAADARRDRVLRRVGYRVLRLPAELVLRDVAAAVARVRAALVP